MIGANIRRRRRELGITQAELADRADRSQQYVSDLERGARDARGSTLRWLADVLETSVDDLLEAQ